MLISARLRLPTFETRDLPQASDKTDLDIVSEPCPPLIIFCNVVSIPFVAIPCPSYKQLRNDFLAYRYSRHTYEKLAISKH